MADMLSRVSERFMRLGVCSALCARHCCVNGVGASSATMCCAAVEVEEIVARARVQGLVARHASHAQTRPIQAPTSAHGVQRIASGRPETDEIGRDAVVIETSRRLTPHDRYRYTTGRPAPTASAGRVPPSSRREHQIRPPWQPKVEKRGSSNSLRTAADWCRLRSPVRRGQGG